MRINYDIFLCVPGLPFDEHSLENRSLGGSETAGLYMAKGLAKRGHHVTMFCTTPDNVYGTGTDGVTYLPVQTFAQHARTVPHDITIIQRQPQLFSQRYNSVLNLLWCHDLALGRQAAMFRGALWNVDKVMVLSEFMRRQYAQVYSIPDSALMLTRNGIDLSLFEPKALKQRKRKQLVYASRPERGLDVLLEHVMPALLREDPEITLKLAGYDNPVVPELAAFYQKCDALIQRLGSAVIKVGALSKRDLYALYADSLAYVYPTPSQISPKFSEVSCITAMECQGAGLPLVASNVGALEETALGQMLVPLKDGRPDVGRIVADVLSLIRNDAAWEHCSNAGLAKAKTLGWDAVAEQWEQSFDEQIAKNNDNPKRLLRHLWRQSDIVAAKSLIASKPKADIYDEQRLIDPWSFMDKPDGYRIQYETIGSGHDTYVIDTVPHEPRFKLLGRWLEQKRAEITTVLDYGCAHGAYATRLAEALPWLHIKGVDIDKYSVKMAQGFADQIKVADRATFETWPNGIPPASKLYDAVLAQEVLEHVPEPWKVMEELESHVKQDGYLYATVPFGPWEYSSYHTYPHRCHIWHFNRHDLIDIFGKKPELSVEAYYYGDSAELGEPMGWWIVSYKADGEPLGRIDIERKLRLQRPRQLVSAHMLIGPNSEETLLWCLRSLQHVADEIVAIDCGTSDLARGFLKEFGAKIVQGPDPKVVGFDVCRNLALQNTGQDMDWVLWIDTDEKLLSVASMQKYLRSNMFSGYGVRQHHFAADTTFNPDMPVRLFRTVTNDKGQKMQFFGSIHEHPEFAINEGPGTVVVASDLHIAHIGYLTEDVRRGRFMRNFPLLQKDIQKNPDRLLQKHFIMRDNIHLVRYALQQSGGQINDDIRAKCRETVELYRKHFLGKGQYMNSESIQYYSEANTILGEGFDMLYQLEADKVDAKPNGGLRKVRFANAKDAELELVRNLHDKADTFDADYY